MANNLRFKSVVAIGAISATVAALLLSQIHLAYVTANEVAFCHKSATPGGLLASHFGFAWPCLALLAFQSFGLYASRFFWLSVVAGGMMILYATSQFDIIFIRGETISWECTDWSWYDGTFLDQALAFFLFVPLLVLFAGTGLAELLILLMVRMTGVHPIDWALSKLARSNKGASQRDAGQMPAGLKSDV